MKKWKSIIVYLVIFIIILCISYFLDSFIINNMILMNRFSYYGTIITGFSLVITFLEIWKAKTIQQEINDAIKERITQKSLQYNPIIQKHLVRLRDFLCQAEFEKAKAEVDIVKNLILHHSKYDDIMKIIKENPYNPYKINKNKINNDIFFETLESQLTNVTISAPANIVAKNIDEFKEYKNYSIGILIKIEACLNQHTGEHQ